MGLKTIVRAFRRKRTYFTLIILCVCFLNVLNFYLHNLPDHTSSTTTTSTKRSTFNSKTTKRKSIIRTVKLPLVIDVQYYRLVPQRRYEYEYRFEYNTSHREDHYRVMILLSGSTRTCTDYWDFAVGRRILTLFRQYGFFTLAICARRRKFDSDSPLASNVDAKILYGSMQKWIHEVFYKRFRQYPRLYIHAVSRGSKFAAIVSRILPIQGQIFTIYPGHYNMMETPTTHPLHLRNRLTDPVFGNWFHFEYCYRNAFEINRTRPICPFGNLQQKLYQPVTPTFFVHTKNDRFFTVKDYTNLIDLMRVKAYRLGGPILSHAESMKFIMLEPTSITVAYVQQFFSFWRSKPFAAQLFYEHFTNRTQYRPINRSRRTCLCLKIDFCYYEYYSNLTESWPQKKLEQYHEYCNDLYNNRKSFCEDVCGDIYAHHAIVSRELDKILDWLNFMDAERKLLNMKEYVERPLRIYMYNKSSIYPQNSSFSLSQFNWANLIKAYRMYAPEYFLQEYFQEKRPKSHQQFQIITDPLLADYYFIPTDLMYFYCRSASNNMTGDEFKSLYTRLNYQYFKPMLEKIQTEFPYWSMAQREDLVGSNHIIALVNGRNMGFLPRSIRKQLRNVVQLVITGIREDLMARDAPAPYTYRGMNITYRHGYDVVLPPFTPVKHNESQMLNATVLVKKKNRLFFFAGELSHWMTPQSARALLSSLISNAVSQNISFQGKQYEQLKVFEGHMKPREYIEAIQSSIFSICPEGFLPWSPRLQEAIQIGAIPIILSDNLVLPFERYIPWRLISVKLNVSQTENLTNLIHEIPNLDQFVIRKLSTASRFINAFQWPYKILEGNRTDPVFAFSPNQDFNGTIPDVFSYLSRELQCRSIEQSFGLTEDTFSLESQRAQRMACQHYPIICPCHTDQQSVAFQQYV